MAEREDVGIWAMDQGILRQKDLEIFESGYLADVEVRCGNHTWKLHKITLCTRSEWFKKALAGSFKEAETRTVTLEEQEPCDISCFLKFIYTGAFNPEKSYPGDDTFVALMRIWKTANFFCHGTLCDLALRAAKSYARKQPQLFCAAFPGVDHDEDVEVFIENSFKPAISLLYTEEMGHLKEIFQPIYMTMAVASVHGLSTSKAFGSLLHDFPQFAADWATVLMGGFDKWKPVSPRRAGGCCNQCGGNMGGKGTVNTLKWIRDHYLMVLCDRCYQVPGLEEWKSTRK